MHDYSNLRRILLEVVLIVALGVIIGLSANLQLIHQVVTGETSSPEPPANTADTETPQSYPEPADLDTTRRLADSGQGLLIDARISEMYAEGHLPGARSLPIDEAGEKLARFREDVPTGTTLITYCNGYGCPDSFDLALLLIEAGYRDVRVFEGGVPEWQGAGLPLTTEAQP